MAAGIHQVCQSGKRQKKRFLSILRIQNIKYEREYTFEELRGLGNCKLRFDFCIFDNLHNVKMLIEYDGKQHFEKTPYMTDNERVRIHDSKKNKYCAENGYPLLRISYKNFTHIEEILNQQNIV